MKKQPFWKTVEASSAKKIQMPSPFPLVLIGCATLLILLTNCGNGQWVQVQNQPCQVFDPQPVETQRLFWYGACDNGYAEGYGTLEVFEGGQINFKCEGSMHTGHLNGMVIFSVFKSDKFYVKYEEDWRDGFRVNRRRNLSLETYLRPAKYARNYLFLLKKYHAAFPDAWIDDFHDVLLQKTFFACADISASTVDGGTIRLTSTLSDAPRKENLPQKSEQPTIKRDELLLKIYEDGFAGSGYYTVFNHRIASLNKLLHNRYIPGGKQFYIEKSSSLCGPDAVPEKLPVHQQTDETASTGDPPPQPTPSQETFWYPVERY